MDHYESYLEHDYQSWLEMPAPDGFDPDLTVAEALGTDRSVPPLDIDALPADARAWLHSPVVAGLVGLSVREAHAIIAADDRVERMCRVAGDRKLGQTTTTGTSMGDAGMGIREGDLLTIAQARRLVPLARSTFYALIESGELPCYRFGGARGRVLVARVDLEAFVARARHGATRAPVAPDVDALLDRVRARRRGVGPPNSE